MSYEPERILDGAPNARDLGGIETADGRVLKYGRLIRSGAIDKITERDAAYLKDIGLNKVVDFRTARERVERPDRVLDGVDYILCPLFEFKTEGITREKPLTEDEDALQSIAMAKRFIAAGDLDGRARMCSLYPTIMRTEHALSHMREFLDVLLRHGEGALLYHCTMGKDRVGTATAVVLSALGVPRETITADYMLTRVRCAEGTKRLIENCRRFCDDEAVLEYIYCLDIVEPEFIGSVYDTIDTVYGGTDRFLREVMQLDDAKLERLRELYLE